MYHHLQGQHSPAKLANCRSPGIWIGYVDGHPTGTYWVLNPKTKKIILNQDITFLQKSYESYGEYSNIEKSALLTMSYEGLDGEEELEMVPILNQNNNNNNNLVNDSVTLA